MLYVDPDVADPNLVAGRLEVAASMALHCGCVFDVATDILQALADLRCDTMHVYRGVFINENLQRHKKSAQSIEGKHLARFLRQAGMSRTRIVLLVGGDVRFDTADAGAHGLSAVLRKPFTRNGFCDVLRSMFLGNEDAGTANGEPPPPPPLLKERSSTATPSTCVSCGSHTPSPLENQTHNHLQCPPPRILPSAFPIFATGVNRRGTGSAGAVAAHAAVAAAAAAAAATAAAAAVNHSRASALPRPAFADCLQFTPFPSAMMEQLGRYSMVPAFAARPSLGPAAQRRRYAKIAPREEDENATIPPQESSPSESTALASVSSPMHTASNAMQAGAENKGGVETPSGVERGGQVEDEVRRDEPEKIAATSSAAGEQAAGEASDVAQPDPASDTVPTSAADEGTVTEGPGNVD